MSEIKITVRNDGSLKIDGDVPLFDADGNRITTPEGRPYSLCRCGRSSKKPFCDGSHNNPAWDGSLAPRD